MPGVKVSVIVPLHNTGKYVDECAPSLLGQSLPADEYEVIYVDDGSTDDTPARVDKRSPTLPSHTPSSATAPCCGSRARPTRPVPDAGSSTRSPTTARSGG